jgi:PIN domain nuclease of toxin-antitoxin system
VCWWLTAPEKITPSARLAISNIENEIYVSAASLWELRLKANKGKISLPRGIEPALEQESISELPIRWKHTVHVSSLPNIHGDPFDRLLIAQALEESLTLVTRDTKIHQYPVSLLKA